MKPSAFLSAYEKLERVVQWLPETLQRRILANITPIKTLFLQQRAPRLVLLGDAGGGASDLVRALVRSGLPAELEELGDGEWKDLGSSTHGAMRVLDARRPASPNILRRALTAEAPDLFIFLKSSLSSAAEIAPELDHAEAILNLVTATRGISPPMLGVVTTQIAGDGTGATRQELNATLHARQTISERLVATRSLATPEEVCKLTEAIAVELPPEAQLEMARLSGHPGLQKQIARVLIKSTTAICSAVGAQPIPLADFPILSSLQATMVAGIMHISGREMSVKHAAKFIGAVGANFGAALALREGARAAARLVPGWGSVISGAIAGGGTYAMGSAAIAYFIDGISLPDARAMLRRGQKNAKPTAAIEE